MARFHLSPSRLARYFYHQCDRYLRYSATPTKRKTSDGVPTKEFDTSPVARLLADGGYRWEEQVVTNQLKGRVHIAKGNDAIHDRFHSTQQTLQLLANPGGKAIYQGTLSPPASFNARYGLDEKIVEFRQCRPDLVELSDGQLQVIDLKATDELKSSHRIQVALYALLLRDILAEASIPQTVDLKTGGVWLHRQASPQRFDLAMTVSIVEAFLREKLPQVLLAPPDQVHWHLYFRCEWCEYFAACLKEAKEIRSVSLIPYLSIGARSYLREAAWGGTPVESLADMASLLGQGNARTVLDACGSLRGKADRLAHSIAALEQGTTIPHGGSSTMLPVFEHVSLIINIQREPVSGKVYAAGFRRIKGKEVYDSGVSEQVFVAASEDDCSRVTRDFILALYKELTTLHNYNLERDWKDQKTLQTYVFDSFEQRLYTDLLLEALEDAELAPIAMQILLHYQGPDLATTNEQPRAEVPYPIVVLTGVLRELVAIPEPLVIKLESALANLKSPSFDYKFKSSDLFSFKLSNALRSEPIHMAWTGTHPEAVQWIQTEIRKRLTATGTLVDGLRAAVSDRLFAWAPRFSLPAPLDFQHPELSKLAFVVRYEAFMAACANRQTRSRPWEERVLEGVSIPLQYLGSNRWKVEPSVDESSIEAYHGFLKGLLVPQTKAGDRDQMAYDDYRQRLARWAPKNGKIRLAQATSWTTVGEGQVVEVILKIASSNTQDAFQIGDQTALQLRVPDFISDKIVARLGQIDADLDNPLVKLLRDPRTYSSRFRPSGATIAARQSVAKDTLTPSQRDAFGHIANFRLTLVWGPPGTGKTHFLAKAIRHLAAGWKKTNQPLRIAVTGFTHAAIENLLREIEDCNVEGSEGLFVAKLGECQTPRGQGLSKMLEGEVATRAPEESFVVGGTVHALRKEYENASPCFDLLIVDEGSQMKIGEFALATLALGPSTRLVIAGDDLQLPPIIKGSYPVAEDGRRGLQDSIFAYLRDRDNDKNPFTCKLLENWRMNDVLTHFSAENLYGAGYVPATAAVADRRLRLSAPKAEVPGFISWILKPKCPLVLCVLDGVQASSENLVEAELVAQLAHQLRIRHLTDNGKHYADSEKGDRAFWQKGLFVVSPHHVQIRAIQRALSTKRDWKSVPFVDTVDKMQGQQAESVIVSYGVSDPETALMEGEFIYSLNRLNVSATRARTKSIIFLPRPLLEPSFEVLGNDEAAKGLGYMLNLLRFCRQGQERVVDLGEMGHGGASLRIYRYGGEAKD